MVLFIRRGAVFLLFLSFLFASIQCSSTTRSAKQAYVLLKRSEDYLWRVQSDDGGWHSRTHGLLRSGQALTPYILYNLYQAQSISSDDAPSNFEGALAFLRDHISEDGVLGIHDTVLLEYPNYASSYALRVFSLMGDSSDHDLIKRMRSYLVSQQFDERRGVANNHPAYGGWGFGEYGLPAGEVGYVDLSHTRRVLQALASAHGHPTTLNEKTQHFLAEVQNRHLIGTDLASHYDGGFHYSPVVYLANKGHMIDTKEDPVFLSYATATCDGLLALIAAGVSKDDERVQDALHWLAVHPELGVPQGIPTDHPAQWQEVMFFYHLAVRAEVYSQFGWPADARESMIQLLSEEIREDGSFLNEAGAPNKENDPLLATTLALSALNHLVASY